MGGRYVNTDQVYLHLLGLRVISVKAFGISYLHYLRFLVHADKKASYSVLYISILGSREIFHRDWSNREFSLNKMIKGKLA